MSKDDLKKISGVQSEEKKVEEPQSSVVKSDANKVAEKQNTSVKSDEKQENLENKLDDITLQVESLIQADTGEKSAQKIKIQFDFELIT